LNFSDITQQLQAASCSCVEDSALAYNEQFFALHVQRDADLKGDQVWIFNLKMMSGDAKVRLEVGTTRLKFCLRGAELWCELEEDDDRENEYNGEHDYGDDGEEKYNHTAIVAYHCATGVEIFRLSVPIEEFVNSAVVFNPRTCVSDTHVVFGHAGSLMLVEKSTKQVTQLSPVSEMVPAPAIVAGTYVAAIGREGVAYVWDISIKNRTHPTWQFQEADRWIQELHVSGGRLVVSTPTKVSVHQLSWENSYQDDPYQERKGTQYSSTVGSFSLPLPLCQNTVFRTDKNFIYILNYSDVQHPKLWDLHTGKEVCSIKLPSGMGYNTTFQVFVNGPFLVVVAGHVYVFDLSDKKGKGTDTLNVLKCC